MQTNKKNSYIYGAQWTSGMVERKKEGRREHLRHNPAGHGICRRTLMPDIKQTTMIKLKSNPLSLVGSSDSSNYYAYTGWEWEGTTMKLDGNANHDVDHPSTAGFSNDDASPSGCTRGVFFTFHFLFFIPRQGVFFLPRAFII
jgi:hypothetical protein